MAINCEAWRRALEALPLQVHRTTWNTPDAIAAALGAVAGENVNHFFMPTGGGLDLLSVRLSDTTPGSIELDFGDDPLAGGRIVRAIEPTRLDFERLPAGDEWSYFRLEGDWGDGVSGSAVVFCKASPYNLVTTPNAYDGKHADRDADEFRSYVEKLAGELQS